MPRQHAGARPRGAARLRAGVDAVQNKLAAVVVEAEIAGTAAPPEAAAALERLIAAAWEASRLLAALPAGAGEPAEPTASRPDWNESVARNGRAATRPPL